MKKKILFLLLLSIFFIPLIVKGASIYTSKVTGLSSVKIGDEFSENFYIRFDGVSQNDKDSLGVAVVNFEIIFDDSILTITGVSSNGWETQIWRDEKTGKYYALSTIEGHPDYVCLDGILNCGRYEISIEFLLKDTTKETTTIKIGEIEAGLLHQIFDDKEISLDDVILVTGKGEYSHTITIKNNEKQTEVSNKESIVQSKTNVNIKQQTTNNTKTTTNNNIKTVKNNSTDKKNNHLKSLIIEDYEISFDKYKSIYQIEVPINVNSLNISALAEGNKAKVSIIGADNLEQNNNKVTIEVTPEEGEAKTYIINVTRVDEKKEIKKESFKLTDEQIEIGKYILIGGILLIVLVFIIIKIRDRHVEKGLDKF